MRGAKKRVQGAGGTGSVPDLDEEFPSPGESHPLCSSSGLKDAILRSRYVQLILLLTLIAAFLRFYALDLSPLWLDEALTYRFSLHPFAEYWGLVSAGGEVHPPLFYWLEHCMLGFGHTETTLRFLPAFFGFLTVPVIYFLGSEAVDRNAGLLAAALLTFSPFHLFYSQEARMYSLMLFFLSFALLCFFRAVKEENLTWWVIFGIFSGLAFWTHYSSIMVIAGVYAWYLVRAVQRKEAIAKLKGMGCSIAVLVVLCLPLLAISWTVLLGRTAVAPTWGNRGLEVLTTSFDHFSGYSAPLAVVFLALFLVGLSMISRTRRETCSLFVMLSVVVFGGNVVLSYFMPVAPRYLIGIIPVFFIGIASSYLALARFKPDRRIIYGCLVLIVLVNIPGLLHHYTVVEKEDWRYVSGLIAQNTAPGDTVVIMPAYMTAPFDFYYDNTTDGTREIGLSSAGEISSLSLEKGKEKIFIAFTDDLNAADPSGQAIQWMQSNAQFAGNQRGVYVFVIVSEKIALASTIQNVLYWRQSFDLLGYIS